MNTSINTVFRGLGIRQETIIGGAALVNIEFLFVAIYLLVAPVTPTGIAVYIYPFVWINVALWALWRVESPPARLKRRSIAGLIAVGYILVLGYLGGLYGFGSSEIATGLRLEFVSLPPGWGPALLYSGESVRFALLPFKVIGYATLAYLVYVTILDTATSAAAGLLGLFSCVSCVLPIIAAVVSGFIGAGGALVAVASGQSYALSTVVFVITVLLLVWRPTAGSFSRLRAKLGS
ncbi:DUF7546 family protein [Halocatena marina]|uniref:ABC transporter ATP-binding protein n=1 Tax=Halocatena marina TaxID=2934937 RepID=A0ABD5YP69_9EURY|nr:hypothetical protein [Halocatena marina]